MYLPNYYAVTRGAKTHTFKLSTAGLNHKFSFSHVSCWTKAKQPSLASYFPIDESWLERKDALSRVY